MSDVLLPPLSPARAELIFNFDGMTSWGIRDPARFQALLAEAKTLVEPGYYLGDNLFTWGRNNSFLDDERFRQAWWSNVQNDADQSIAWRRYLLVCAACHVRPLTGDFVECGVYLGSGIKTVIDYFGAEDFPQHFWGYDVFDFNPQGHVFADQKEGLYERVCARFADYPRVHLIRGLLPESFAQGVPEKIAYLHIDLNQAEPEISVLEALFERVVSGGIIMLDDYEWAMVYRAQKIQEDPWFERRGYRVWPLPTGQGMVIKR